jgi:hypothetical protein
MFGVWLFEFSGAHHADALRTADEFRAWAGRTGDPADRAAANVAAAISGVHLGNLAQARRHFEAAARSFSDLTDMAATRWAFGYGGDFVAASHAYGAWCFWLLGYADQALRLGNEALAISTRIRHDYSRARGLYLNSTLHAYRRGWQTVDERATAAIASAQEHGFPMVVAVGRIMRGAGDGGSEGGIRGRDP